MSSPRWQKSHLKGPMGKSWFRGHSDGEHDGKLPTLSFMNCCTHGDSESRRRRSAARCAMLPDSARKFLLAGSTLIMLGTAYPAPPEGDCSDCLGVVDGLLADCPAGRGSCVSSQDDSPVHFQEPWEYEGSKSIAMQRLRNLLDLDSSASIVKADDDYIRVEFRDAWGNVDDAEFYFTPEDVTVQFRSNRRGAGQDFNINKTRMESIRKALGFTKIPILRNRRRAFVFFESPFDSFGPTTLKNMDVMRVEDGPDSRFDKDPLAPAPEPLRNKYRSTTR